MAISVLVQWDSQEALIFILETAQGQKSVPEIAAWLSEGTLPV
jgi:hypothetical protein